MKRLRIFATLAATAVVLAACGSGDVLAPPDDGTDGPLIQIHSEGGFVPVEWNLGRGPLFTVTKDGDFIFQGVTTLEYPGRLVPPYMIAQLDQAELDEISRMLEEMGIAEIDDEHDDSVQNVADASTEVIRYWDDTGIHRYSVYALGITDQATPATTTAFAQLFDYLHQLSASVEAVPYEPERVRIVAGASYEGQDPDFIDIRDWPLEGESPDDWDVYTTVGEDQEWTCKVFDGSVLEKFADATQATLWTHPDETGDAQNIKLLVRPLHPGEEDCSI